MRRKKITWYQWFFNSWPFLLSIWLFIGFALGTLILLFPLRSWVSFARERQLSELGERMGVVVLILELVIVSFIISLKIFNWQKRKRKAAVTFAAIAIPLVLALSALALFMSPELVNRGSESSQLSQQFTIGPYPTEAKIRSLKKEGFTGIISLLHPAVVPFEPQLIHEEEEASKEIGIELIKAPMLPWIGDNTSSLNTIERLVKSGKGRYYVHCYLGKDRVNVVKNTIARITGDSSKIRLETAHSQRTFESIKSFERGEIYKLADDVYLTPYPTNEEFLAFFLAGKVKSVVNLMDKSVKENGDWIEKEKSELQKTTVQFHLYSLREDAPAKTIQQVVDSVLSLPKPIVVHRWNTKSEATLQFRKLFFRKTGIAALNLSTNVPETY
jgi:protein tyrosine phosphatase (PTP) superfamily phosphohydrolase (DUF442 family)